MTALHRKPHTAVALAAIAVVLTAGLFLPPAAERTPLSRPPQPASQPMVCASPSAPPTTKAVAVPQVGSDAAPWLQATAKTLALAPSDHETGRYAHIQYLAWYADLTIGDDHIGRSETRVEHTEGWFADDGAATLITTVYPPGTTNPRKGKPTAVHRADEPPGTFHTSFPGPPSSDPATLRTQLKNLQPPQVGPQAIVRATAALVREYALSCPVRAALLHHLATTTPIWRGEVTDRLGRPGTAISIDDPDGVERDVLIIDPTTGTILAYHELLLRNPGRLAGAFPQDRSYTAFLQNGRSETLQRAVSTRRDPGQRPIPEAAG